MSALAKAGSLERVRAGNRWIYPVASVDQYLRHKPRLHQCRSCWSMNTYRRRFRAMDDPDVKPKLIAVWQCRDCGEIRVTARA